ncbi:MAG: site-specific DNA-methyltransferase [Planctomycetes bacterium]|nr:site-specific DNA-methyltransferase [Planctomycetota bacterium]
MARIQPDSKATEDLQWGGQLKNGSTWIVYCGDARKVLQKIPSATFDCVVTSPPYYWLRDYDVEEQIGLEETVEGYVSAVNGVMEEVFRVLRENGLLFLNLGDTYYSGKGKSHGTDPKSSRRRFGLRAVDKSGGLDVNAKPKSALGIPWRVAMRMSENGWVLRSPIVWHRKHCLPESVQDRPRRSYEYVFMFAKNRKYFFDRKPLVDVDEEDMWSIVARHRSPNGLGTAPFPDELVQRCLAIGCPAKGMVLDPFAGSGTTLRVAVKSGRCAKGIDLNRTFCDHIVEELEKIE